MRAIMPLLLLLVVPISVTASPPPPPPPWVSAAGKILATPGQFDYAKAADFFAEDVQVAANGVVVANNKPDRLAFRKLKLSRVLGYSEGWSRCNVGGGDLMVIDTFDSDLSHLPPGIVVDPRMKVRSTLYRFGADHLIHGVQIARVEGFWMLPSEPTAKPPA